MDTLLPPLTGRRQIAKAAETTFGLAVAQHDPETASASYFDLKKSPGG
jgi:hypothetical protein